jgi:outer membrane lipoprotein-sorting protein
MKTGLPERRRALAALALTPLLLTARRAVQAQPAAFDLAALATLLASRKSAEARFVEERFVAGLDQPLRSSGTLSFQAPGRFVRSTLEPRPEMMAVDGNDVTLQRGGRTRRMSLDAVPEATALVEAIRGTLTGDMAALRRHYQPRVEGSAARWRLLLVPNGQRLGTQVKQLELEGSGAELRHVEVLLTGGDRSVMTIETIRK